MTIFIFTFIFLTAVVIIMSLGVIFMGKNIKGSCGGLNALSGSDKCLVCNKDIDPNSPLIDRLGCEKMKKNCPFFSFQKYIKVLHN